MVFGPTAVGKTSLLVRILGGISNNRFEIINADSMQVYRYLDIGTAKPDAVILEKIPHHLIDIVDPDEQFTVGDFVREAERLVAEISERGKIPVISGGTAFYLKTFICGMPETPVGNKEVRKKLKERLFEKGLASMYRQLENVDPLSAGRIRPGDSYRILRALEVYYSTGRPLSSYRRPDEIRRDYDLLMIGLERERADLYGRIERRVDDMFERGLAGEVKGLIEQGYRESDPGMKGIGYREFFEFRRGCGTLDMVRELIKRNTRRYAKRQITFMKKLKGVFWYHADDEVRILSLIRDFIGEFHR